MNVAVTFALDGGLHKVGLRIGVGVEPSSKLRNRVDGLLDVPQIGPERHAA